MPLLDNIGISRDALDEAVRNGYISKKSHPDDRNLVIFNYTKKTQYERVWTPETLAARGLIVRENEEAPEYDEVVARPFQKFFNLGEMEEVPEGPFVAFEKMDGSLGIIYEAPDGFPAVATRGSFVSDQALWATGYLRSKISLALAAEHHYKRGETVLVEIIHPDNRIVVNYGDMRDLVGLAAIDNETGRDVPLEWPGVVAQRYEEFDLSVFETPANLIPTGDVNREGVVLLWEDGTRAKVKFEEYMRLHRILSRVTERSIWELLSEGRPIASLADYVPDEFYDWMREVEADLNRKFSAVEQEAFKVLSAVDRSLSRKEQAEFILSKPNPGIVFLMLDGKPYRDKIWPMIRPEANTAFSDRDEDGS